MNLKLAEEHEDFIVIQLDGRLDAETIATVENYIAPVLPLKNVVIDMCRVEYMASLGIRMLLHLAKAAKQSGKKVVLANPQRFVMGVLELANIDSIIAVLPNVEDAKRFL